MVHYGLSAEYCRDGAATVTRHGVKVLALVQGIARTTSTDCGTGKEVTTKVKDPMGENVDVTLRTYCDSIRELDYKLDRQFAVVSVTGRMDSIFDIDAVTVIGNQQVEHSKKVLAQWFEICFQIGVKEMFRDDLKRQIIQMTPTRLKKCRTLASSPSDPKEP